VVTAAPPALVAVACALLLTVPSSASAWVSAYVAVQVVEAVGVRVVAGQVIAERLPSPVKLSSWMASPLTVTFPVLVTRNE
jgi:hypothetical protein